MNFYDLISVFIVGAAVGMAAVAIPASSYIDRLKETIEKLQIDLRYARKGK